LPEWPSFSCSSPSFASLSVHICLLCLEALLQAAVKDLYFSWSPCCMAARLCSTMASLLGDQRLLGLRLLVTNDILGWSHKWVFKPGPILRDHSAHQLTWALELVDMYSVSQKKVAPLKLFVIFSLRLRIFQWNFANLLSVYIHTWIPILVDFS